MSTFDKFRNSGKVFWDSSGIEISKKGKNLSLFPKKAVEEEYKKTLEEYYSVYGIDVLDTEIIKKIIALNNINTQLHYTSSQVYQDLKDIQRTSKNYVTDFKSYKDCLKAYYDIHGKDTEWLVKIFVERYDLDRFDISVEDVLDDVHELMGTVAELPSLKKELSTKKITNTAEISNTVPVQIQKELLGLLVSDTEIYRNLDLSDMGDFHAYVTGCDHWELIHTIQEQYSKIKKNCKYAPALGENGCLEFAAGLLLYTHIMNKLHQAFNNRLATTQEKQELSNLFITITISIGCAFMGATPTEWSNMADDFVERSTFLSKREWSVVYLYLRDYHADDIRKMEFNHGNSYSHMADRKKTNDIITSARGDIEKVKKYFTSQGLLMW